jgi:hypothetical protein
MFHINWSIFLWKFNWDAANRFDSNFFHRIKKSLNQFYGILRPSIVLIFMEFLIEQSSSSSKNTIDRN